MSYNGLRHLADSWGLVAMATVFVILIAWPFRRGASPRNDDAANIIFKDNEND